MNEVRLTGRLVKDPEIRQTKKGSAMATYTLAVDRWNSSTKSKEADFIRITAFGKNAEFVEKWLHKGDPIMVYGSIKTQKYERGGEVKYSTDIWVEKHEFPLVRKTNEPTAATDFRDDDFFINMAAEPSPANDDFIVIPDGVGDEGLPFA